MKSTLQDASMDLCIKDSDNAPLPPAPAWLDHAIIYQIYPQSYQDSNGDGIGDLPGLISRLDYIKSIGVDVIWLNPVFDSPFFDAGYDVRDFRLIAPRYGTNEDAKQLFAEAHRRGIKVIFDLVAGHTSDQHPWFIESAKASANQFSDRYIWTSDRSVQPDRFISGKYERNGCYQKNFFDCQPALNYGNANPDPNHPWEQSVDAPGPQETLAELKSIMTFWMDMGCDGFRVDMAASLIKNDPSREKLRILWRSVRTEFGRKYPDFLLVAEWGCPREAIDAGFHIDFMLHCGTPGYPSLFFNEMGTFHHPSCYFDLRGKGSPDEFVRNWLEQNKTVNGRGFITVPSANHDFQRPNCGPRDANQLRVVWAFLLTWPGVPFIYYGDEIGMRFIEGDDDKEGSVLVQANHANRAGSRTPMQWDTSDHAGFSTVADGSKLYLPIDPDPARPSVADQNNDPASLLNFVRKLIGMRKTRPALRNRSPVRVLTTDQADYPFVYLREAEGQYILTVLNPSGTPITATVNLDAVTGINPIMADKARATLEKGKIKLNMESVSYGIFDLKGSF
jgi:maltose alpha-D-glucosyltransferase/alpha-amylase